MKITDYKLIRDTDESKVEKLIKTSIEKGWQPSGQLIFAPKGNDDEFDWFYQAMVKVDEDDGSDGILGEIEQRLGHIADVLAEIEKSIDRR
jgi:hypothetical protein